MLFKNKTSRNDKKIYMIKKGETNIDRNDTEKIKISDSSV